MREIPPPTPEELERFERAKARLSESIRRFEANYVHVDRVREVVAELRRRADGVPEVISAAAYADAADHVARELLGEET